MQFWSPVFAVLVLCFIRQIPPGGQSGPLNRLHYLLPYLRIKPIMIAAVSKEIVLVTKKAPPA